MSKYIPPSKRNNPNLNSNKEITNEHIDKHEKKFDKYIPKQIDNKKIETVKPIMKNSEEFPPLPSNIVKKDQQLGVWKNKIVITKEIPPHPKVKLSTYLHDSSSNKKQNIKVKDIEFNEDNEDDYIYDRHVYLDDEYYSS